MSISDTNFLRNDGLIIYEEAIMLMDTGNNAGNTKESIPSTRPSFATFILKGNKEYLWSAIAIGIAYFIVLRSVYPVPSFYSDSFTWVGAAKNNQPVTFRPIGYSKLLQFFKYFSINDLALTASQYFSNLIANLILFFTCNYFFTYNRVSRIMLFALLILNPFYLFYSNYVSADAFFCSFTIAWFTLLIWILYKPSLCLVVAQLALLALLFQLRYNAIIFPAITALALVISKQAWWKKMVYIFSGFLLIALLMFSTVRATERYTGTRIFSAFGGWQLANNAMHILRYEKPDTSTIADKQTKELLLYTLPFFDTASFIPDDASGWYMWHVYSPLKKNMDVYAKKKVGYFRTWNALGPIYSKFGKTIILKEPFTYLEHFVIPNCRAYFFPSLEVYRDYMEGNDTIAHVAQEYYHYKTNRTPQHYPLLYTIVFNPWKNGFTIMNALFIGFTFWYLLSKNYKRQSRLFNYTLLCFSALYLANFFFVVLLAPSVLRYHTFILTLLFPVTLYMMQQLKLETSLHKL